MSTGNEAGANMGHGSVMSLQSAAGFINASLVPVRGAA